MNAHAVVLLLHFFVDLHLEMQEDFVFWHSAAFRVALSALLSPVPNCMTFMHEIKRKFMLC